MQSSFAKLLYYAIQIKESTNRCPYVQMKRSSFKTPIKATELKKNTIDEMRTPH